MGSDLYMEARDRQTWTPPEPYKRVAGQSADEFVAMRLFKTWYSENVAARDDPDNILRAWQIFWAGYKAHIEEDLLKHR